MSNLPTFLEGDLSFSKNLSVASSKVSLKIKALGLFLEVPKCSRETAKAKNSPKESQRKWFSSKNCCTCLGAEPPAPVSNKPPPFIKGTIDNIFAEVPTSKIGNKSVR